MRRVEWFSPKKNRQRVPELDNTVRTWREIFFPMVYIGNLALQNENVKLRSAVLNYTVSLLAAMAAQYFLNLHPCGLVTTD